MLTKKQRVVKMLKYRLQPKRALNKYYTLCYEKPKHATVIDSFYNLPNPMRGHKTSGFWQIERAVEGYIKDSIEHSEACQSAICAQTCLCEDDEFRERDIGQAFSPGAIVTRCSILQLAV
jgi:hypothetical protein